MSLHLDNYYITVESMGAGSICIWNGSSGKCVHEASYNWHTYCDEVKKAEQLCNALNTTVHISEARRKLLNVG